jgi:hypothetical protein
MQDDISRFPSRAWSRPPVIDLTQLTIATAYANEWSQLLALSEPLNWTPRWSAPEYRIGS